MDLQCILHLSIGLYKRFDEIKPPDGNVRGLCIKNEMVDDFYIFGTKAGYDFFLFITV